MQMRHRKIGGAAKALIKGRFAPRESTMRKASRQADDQGNRRRGRHRPGRREAVRRSATGIGFLDHMLDLLARHSRIDMEIKAKGDLHIDHHHTTEDVEIALGQAVKQALGDMKGITRYADVHLPMDEALTRVAIDISGRRSWSSRPTSVRDKVGPFDTELVQEWFQAFAINAAVTLHVATLYGTNDHHHRRIVASKGWHGRCGRRSPSIRGPRMRYLRPKARSAPYQDPIHGIGSWSRLLRFEHDSSGNRFPLFGIMLQRAVLAAED